MSAWPAWGRAAVLAAVLAAGLLAEIPAARAASSCCLPASSSFPLQLGSCEQAGVGLQVAGLDRLGSWDTSGQFHTTDAYDRRAMTATATGLVRLTPTVQAFASAASGYLVTRGVSPGSDLSGGDVSVGARWISQQARPLQGEASLAVGVPLGEGEGVASDAPWGAIQFAGVRPHARSQTMVSSSVRVSAAGPHEVSVTAGETVRLSAAADATISAGYRADTDGSRSPVASVGVVWRPAVKTRGVVAVGSALPVGVLGRMDEANTQASVSLLQVLGGS